MRDVLTILIHMFLHYHQKLYLTVKVIGSSLNANKVKMVLWKNINYNSKIENTLTSHSEDFLICLSLLNTRCNFEEF